MVLYNDVFPGVCGGSHSVRSRLQFLLGDFCGFADDKAFDDVRGVPSRFEVAFSGDGEFIAFNRRKVER